MIEPKLPPLPEPAGAIDVDHGHALHDGVEIGRITGTTDGYSEEQMRDFYELGYAAGRSSAVRDYVDLNDASPVSDGKINEITQDVLGKWPSFEAQSWACKVTHAVLAALAQQQEGEAAHQWRSKVRFNPAWFGALKDEAYSRAALRTRDGDSHYEARTLCLISEARKAIELNRAKNAWHDAVLNVLHERTIAQQQEGEAEEVMNEHIAEAIGDYLAKHSFGSHNMSYVRELIREALAEMNPLYVHPPAHSAPQAPQAAPTGSQRIAITEPMILAIDKRPDGSIASVWQASHSGKCERAFAMGAPVVPEEIQDHLIAQIVNQLRDVAIEFHAAQQLRARIANILVPIFKQQNNKIESLSLEIDRLHENLTHAGETGYDAAVSGVHELFVSANGCAALHQDNVFQDGDKPICRFVREREDGDESARLTGFEYWALADDQSGTVLEELAETREQIRDALEEVVKSISGPIWQGDKPTDWLLGYKDARRHIIGIIRSLQSKPVKMRRSETPITASKDNRDIAADILSEVAEALRNDTLCSVKLLQSNRQESV
jgi:hypothetical protein